MPSECTLFPLLLLWLIGWLVCFSHSPLKLAFPFNWINVERAHRIEHVALLGSPLADVTVTVSLGGRTPKVGQQNSLPRPEAMAVAAAETAAAVAAVLPSWVPPSIAGSPGKLNDKPMKPSERVLGVRRPAAESFLMPLWPTVMSGGAQFSLEWSGNEQVGGVDGVLGLLIPPLGDFFDANALPANGTIPTK